MSPRTRQKEKRQTGITHFPLDAEEDNQERVPPRGATKEGSENLPAPGTGSVKGHRLSRQEGRGEVEVVESDGEFAAKSGKGGKTSGSRAGVVSSRKVPKGSRR